MIKNALFLLIVLILGLSSPALAAYSPTAWDFTQANTGNNTLVINSGTFQTINTTSGNVTLTLPSAAATRGKVFAFKRITSASNTATISRAGSDTIEGSNSITLALNQVVVMQSDGTTTWKILTDSSSFQPSDATLTSLAAFNTNGLLTQTAADTFTARTISGTTNQIDLTNGNGVSGNPTVALASNLTMPGSAGFLPPSGNTAARGSTDGQIRFNSQTGKLEGRESGSWSDLISSGSSAYSTIQEEGSGLTQRSTLNFIGDNLLAADNSGSSRTDVTLNNNLDKLPKVESSTSDSTLTTSSASVQIIDATGGNVTKTLPSASSSTNKIFTFKRIGTGTNICKFQRAGSDTISINALTEFTLEIGQTVTIQSDGTTNWKILHSTAPRIYNGLVTVSNNENQSAIPHPNSGIDTEGKILVASSFGGYSWTTLKRPRTPEVGIRLSLTSGTAVTTSDVTAATTLYAVPVKGGNVPVNSSSFWESAYLTSQLSLSLSGLSANTNYDIFLTVTSSTYDAVTKQYTSTTGLEAIAWTNNTTRATSLVEEEGYLLANEVTKKLYLGTIRITGTTGQCEDSAANRFVWNYYNRVNRHMSKTSSATTWTYSTKTWRQLNNGTGTVQVSFVTGLAEDAITASATEFCQNSTSNRAGYCGIGVDSTSTNSAQQTGINSVNQTTYNSLHAFYTGIPSIGSHTIYPLEAGNGSSTTTWQGSGNDSFLIPGILVNYMM